MTIKELINLNSEKLLRAILIIPIIWLAGKLYFSEIKINTLSTKIEGLNKQINNYGEQRRIEDRKRDDSISVVFLRQENNFDSILSSILKNQIEEVRKSNKIATKEIQKTSNLIKSIKN